MRQGNRRGYDNDPRRSDDWNNERRYYSGQGRGGRYDNDRNDEDRFRGYDQDRYDDGYHASWEEDHHGPQQYRNGFDDFEDDLDDQYDHDPYDSYDDHDHSSGRQERNIPMRGEYRGEYKQDYHQNRHNNDRQRERTQQYGDRGADRSYNDGRGSNYMREEHAYGQSGRNNRRGNYGQRNVQNYQDEGNYNNDAGQFNRRHLGERTNDNTSANFPERRRRGGYGSRYAQ